MVINQKLIYFHILNKSMNKILVSLSKNMKLSFLSSASLYIVGSFFGSLVAGVQIRYCGRKFTMQTANIVILCGFLASRFGYNVSLLYIGRVLIGYSNGLWQQCAPVYTGEINQAKIRKITGSFFVVSLRCLCSVFAVSF